MVITGGWWPDRLRRGSWSVESWFGNNNSYNNNYNDDHYNNDHHANNRHLHNDSTDNSVVNDGQRLGSKSRSTSHERGIPLLGVLPNVSVHVTNSDGDNNAGDGDNVSIASTYSTDPFSGRRTMQPASHRDHGGGGGGGSARGPARGLRARGDRGAYGSVRSNHSSRSSTSRSRTHSFKSQAGAGTASGAGASSSSRSSGSFRTKAM